MPKLTGMLDSAGDILKIVKRNRRRKWYRLILRIALWPALILGIAFALTRP